MKDLDHSSQKSVKESDFVALVDSNKSMKKLGKKYPHETIKNRISSMKYVKITVKHSAPVIWKNLVQVNQTFVRLSLTHIWIYSVFSFY